MIERHGLWRPHLLLPALRRCGVLIGILHLGLTGNHDHVIKVDRLPYLVVHRFILQGRNNLEPAGRAGYPENDGIVADGVQPGRLDLDVGGVDLRR